MQKRKIQYDIVIYILYFVIYIQYNFLLILFDRNGNVLHDEITTILNQKGFTNVKDGEDTYAIKSCTCTIDGNVDFNKVEVVIRDI